MPTLSSPEISPLVATGAAEAPCVPIAQLDAEPSSLNLPNAITLSRLLLAGYVWWRIDQGEAWLVTALLFVVAVATDAVDGYLARRWGQITVFGRIVDPLVDKLIIIGSLLFLQNVEGSGVTPWITLLVLGRELVVTSLRAVVEQSGQDFSASWSGKLKMACQSVAVAVCLVSLAPEFAASPWIAAILIPLRSACLGIAIAVTLLSGLESIFRAWRLATKQLS